MYRVLSRPRVSKGFNGIVNAFSVASSTKVPASAEENILFHESRTHPHGFQRLSVSFIGTGTFPSVFRSSPCTVLNFDSHMWVFDLGDGSMRQLVNSTLKYGHIHKVFISRLEHTYLFGLPQLLAFDTGNGSNAIPLHIYGPPGLGNFVTASMDILRNQNRRQVVVHELHHPNEVQNALQDKQYHTYRTAKNPPAQLTSTPTALRQTLASSSSPSLSASAELLLTIEKLFPEKTGFWRLVDETEVEVLANVVCQSKTTFGFVVREVNKQGSVDLEAAKTLGVPTVLIKPLKHGKEVFLSTINRVVKPSDVLKAPTLGRKVVIMNTGNDARTLLPAAKGADLVVHDSCYLRDLSSSALRQSHSTATQAATFFLACRARFLALTRFGGMNGEPQFTNRKVKQELQSVIRPNLYVITRDFLELDIPKGGLNRNSRIVHSTCATPIALKHGHEYSGDVYRGETAGDEEDGLGVGVGEAVVCEGKGVGSAVRSTSVASVVSESAKTVSSTVPNTSTYAAHPSFTGTKQIRQNTMVNTSTSSKPRRVPTARPRKEPKVEEDMFGPIIKKSSP